MLGEVFEIYEIDEWGGAWVQYQSHSLSLESDEMELVEGQTQANATKRFNRTAKT
jgi:hypothetical protein